MTKQTSPIAFGSGPIGKAPIGKAPFGQALTPVSLIALACALGYAPAAIAQDAPAIAQQPVTETPASDTSPTEEDQKDVIVTGSRIQRAGFTAPTPTTIVGTETIEARAAVSIANVLFELPSVQPRPFPAGISQAGGNFISLRGFGNDVAAASRTLVLVDGRRFVPSNNQGQVDLNVVPTALVDRLDIVTGGASAAYGSDAVAGVVNIILKKKLDGIQGNAQLGISDKGDGRTFQASLAGGTSFADGRGQFLIAGEYSKSESVRNGARDYANQHSVYSVNAAHTFLPYNATYDRVRVDGVTLSGYTTGGVIVQASGAPLAATSPLYGRQFLTSTSSAPYRYGTILPQNGGQIGGDGGWVSDFGLLAPPIERQSVFGRTSFEVSNTTTLWAEGSFSRSRVDVDQSINAIPGGGSEPFITIRRTNPYIPADIQAILAANPTIASFSLGRIAPELGNLHTDSRVRTLRGAIGADGKIGTNLRWNAYYTHGDTRFRTDLTNNIIEANLSAALDVVVNPTTGRPDCAINITPPTAASPAFGAAAGCIPANPFGVGSLANVKDYVTGDLVNTVSYKQDAAGLNLQGEPFSTWAGPVSFAVGAEYRHEALDQAVSPYADFVTSSFPTGGFQNANPKSFRGAITVKEAFGELDIPLLSRSAIGYSLNLNGAVRYTDYGNIGNVTTWKVGGTYAPVDGLLFRAVRSRDSRVATLTQLYGNSTAAATLVNQSLAVPANASYGVINVGNPNLRPEAADTTTVGVTFSRIIPGFSLSVDYYDITLKNFIAQLSNQAVIDSCYGKGTASVADPSRCVYITNPTATATGVLRNPQLNLGTVTTRGIDIEASYTLPLSKLGVNSEGSFNFRVLANYVDTLLFNNTGLLPIERAGDLGGTPKWRWTLSTAFRNGPLLLTATGRFVGAMTIDVTQTSATAFEFPKTPNVFYLNTGIQYRVVDTPGQRIELYFNVNNLLDRDPPFVVGVNGIGARGGVSGVVGGNYYDVLGRTYTTGIRFKF